MSPLGPLLQQIAARLAKNPELQRKVSQQAAQVGRQSAQAIHQARQAVEKQMGAMGLGSAAKSTANSSTAGTKQSSSTAAGNSSKTESSGTGSTAAGGAGAKAQDIFGRAAAGAKRAFSQFNLARDFMLVIMAFQLLQALYHYIFGGSHKPVHRLVQDQRRDKQQLEEKKHKEEQQQGEGANQVLKAASSPLSNANVRIHAAMDEAAEAEGESKHQQRRHHRHPTGADDSSHNVNLSTFGTTAAASQQPSAATGSFESQWQASTTFTFGDGQTEGGSTVMSSRSMEGHQPSSASSIAADPLSRSNSLLSSWGSSGQRDRAKVLQHSEDVGLGTSHERVYDPLRR